MDKQGGSSVTEFAVIVDTKVDNGKVYVKALKTKLVGSNNVDPEHVPWIPWNITGMISASGAPDKGSIVRLEVGIGQGATGLGRIVELVNNTVSASSFINGLPNAKPIYQLVDQLKAEARAINLPPNLQETINAAGAKVVEAIEKGEHYLAVLNGLNISGAQGQLAGVVIPQMKNIATAFTPAAAIITGSMASLLPGTNFNLGNLLNILPDALKEELFKNMPKELQGTLNSYLSLMQNYQVSNSGGSISGMRVNLEVFLPNVVNALKNVQTPDELIDALENIMSDTSLFGLDQLANVAQLIPTAFGNMSMSFGADGNISVDFSSLTSSLGGALTSQLTNLSSLSSSLLGSTGLSSLVSGITGANLGALTSQLSGQLGSLSAAAGLLGNVPNFGQITMALPSGTGSLLQSTLGKIQGSKAFADLVGNLGV